MKRGARIFLGLASCLACCGGALAARQGRNSISGHVFGESRRPLPDVFVEQLDDLEVTVGRTKTNGSGRYEFAGLREGRFKVRMLPYATDYAEQMTEVRISNVSALGGGTGGETRQLDF